jgi:glucan phosphoethanolaminetransferase (alkaline phosphatase superfamily)
MPTKKQQIFRDMFVGVLLYTVVLGFFNDYTSFLHTGTYSVTFSLAVVLQILTYLTFAFKDWIKTLFPKNRQTKQKVGLGFSIWLIMFFSKFVFLGVISVIFKDDVEISGFVGLLLIVACLTLAQKLAGVIYEKLGD